MAKQPRTKTKKAVIAGDSFDAAPTTLGTVPRGTIFKCSECGAPAPLLELFKNVDGVKDFAILCLQCKKKCQIRARVQARILPNVQTLSQMDVDRRPYFIPRIKVRFLEETVPGGWPPLARPLPSPPKPPPPRQSAGDPFGKGKGS